MKLPPAREIRQEKSAYAASTALRESSQPCHEEKEPLARPAPFTSKDESEVVRAALRLMKEEETKPEPHPEWPCREVDRGWLEGQAGRLTPSTEARAELAAFKTRWKAGQPVVEA